MFQNASRTHYLNKVKNGITLLLTLFSSGAPLFDNINKVARGVLHGCIGECCSRKFPSIFTRIDDREVWNFIHGLNETSSTNFGNKDLLGGCLQTTFKRREG